MNVVFQEAYDSICGKTLEVTTGTFELLLRVILLMTLMLFLSFFVVCSDVTCGQKKKSKEALAVVDAPIATENSYEEDGPEEELSSNTMRIEEPLLEEPPTRKYPNAELEEALVTPDELHDQIKIEEITRP